MAQSTPYLTACPNEILDQIVAALIADIRYTKPLEAISQTNKQFRELSKPLLFQHVSVNGDWPTALEIMNEMIEQPDFKCYVKSFKFDMQKATFSQFSSLAPPIVKEILSEMPKLKLLELVLRGFDQPAVYNLFRKAKGTLPTVETLVLGPHFESAISLCPNVKAISTGDLGWQYSHVLGHQALGREERDAMLSLISAAAKTDRLCCFAVMVAWNHTILGVIAREMPELLILTMYHGYYDCNIPYWTTTLARCTKLRCLAYVGTDINIWKHDYGRRFRGSTELQTTEPAWVLSAAMMQACPSIKDVFFGASTRMERVSDMEEEDSWYVVPARQSWGVCIRRHEEELPGVENLATRILGLQEGREAN